MKNNKDLGPIQKTVVGAQFLFVAFGATVLVPLLVGLDPSVALFTAGVGTLIFHLVTKGKVPIFLGSSFAFIAPIVKATELYGLPGTLSGLVAVLLEDAQTPLHQLVVIRLVAGGALEHGQTAFLCEGYPNFRDEDAFHIQTYYVHMCVSLCA